ncbi:MAG TPA: thioredoxin [Nitrososphaera sp.]|nr:thioredoxin [Nitrososphaera sp.]
MDFDNELEAIKHKKLAELQREAATKAMMGAITEPIVLTDSNFANEVMKYPIMLVDFWAPWCGPCRMVSPVIEQLSREYSGKVAFGKVNVDENQRLAASFGIQSIPTLMIFKGSKAVDVMVGAMSKAQIEMKLKQQLSSNNDSIYR